MQERLFLFFLLLLHLSFWNVPSHSHGGGYQDNLAYMPGVTQWSMCVDLRGNKDPTEKWRLSGGVAHGRRYFPLPTPRWESRNIEEVVFFHEAQPQVCYEVKLEPRRPTTPPTKTTPIKYCGKIAILVLWSFNLLEQQGDKVAHMWVPSKLWLRLASTLRSGYHGNLGKSTTFGWEGNSNGGSVAKCHSSGFSGFSS